jgi:hypothetical protein
MERNRAIRTNTRASGGNYKIECKGIKRDEMLYITITHESIPDFMRKYEISGNQFIGKDSISFNTVQTGNEWRISWKGGILPKVVLK